MSGLRFGLLVAALGLLVAAGSFAAGLAVLDDGRPDPPPTGGDGTSSTFVPVDATSSTTTTTTTAPPGELADPAWLTIVASEGSEAAAREAAALVAARGYPTGVLRSDDYASLNSGLWVAYAGPYPDRRAAEAAVDALAQDGIEGTYVRCAGSVAACKGGGGSDDDD